ncbi:MAG: hypothetical protein ACKV19_18635 [Verrucomicrobiales bacterium]
MAENTEPSGRVERQGAFVIEAIFLWDPVGEDDVFQENRGQADVLGDRARVLKRSALLAGRADKAR